MAQELQSVVVNDAATSFSGAIFPTEETHDITNDESSTEKYTKSKELDSEFRIADSNEYESFVSEEWWTTTRKSMSRNCGNAFRYVLLPLTAFVSVAAICLRYFAQMS